MATVRRWTGREARALRQALRLSVRVFAEHLGVAARTVSKWETGGEHTCPRPDTQAILDTALGRADSAAQERFVLHIGDVVDSGREPMLHGEPSRPQPERGVLAVTAPAVSQPAASTTDGLLESPAEVAARRTELQSSNLTSELLAELEQFLAGLPDRYESAGPLALAPDVVHARKLAHQLLAGNQRLKERARLFDVAGHLSAKLSYMEVNLGNFGAAHAYGAEAFELARFIEHDDLTAWVRGTQSLAAYYTGDYQRSLVLASIRGRLVDGFGVLTVKVPSVQGESGVSKS